MAPRRKVSNRQLKILLDFAEQNRDVAMGRHPPGPGYLGVERARNLWNTLATELNSVAEGTIKTGEQWKRYWIEYKTRIRGKGADARRSHNVTGGGPSQLTPLTPVEERLLALIGTVAVEGMPRARIPLNLNEPPTASVQPHAAVAELHLPAAQLHSPAAQRHVPTAELQVLVADLQAPLAEPQGPVAEPQGPVAEPHGPVAEPQGPVAEPHGPVAEPQGLLEEAPTPPLPYEAAAGEEGPLVSAEEGEENARPTTGDSAPAPRRPRPRSRPSSNIPSWAYNLEQRQLAGQERLIAAVERGGRGVIRELHTLAATVAQLATAVNVLIHTNR